MPAARRRRAHWRRRGGPGTSSGFRQAPPASPRFSHPTAGGTNALIASLDRYLPTPHLHVLGIDLGIPLVDTVPLSAAVANLLDAVALIVNPLALNPITS